MMAQPQSDRAPAARAPAPVPPPRNCVAGKIALALVPSWKILWRLLVPRVFSNLVLGGPHEMLPRPVGAMGSNVVRMEFFGGKPLRISRRCQSVRIIPDGSIPAPQSA